MAHAPEPQAAVVYAAARTFVDRALRTSGSLFTGHRHVWATAVVDDLRARVTAGHGLPAGTFDERWGAQLAGAPDAALQLAGELVYVHVLFATDLSPATKRRLVHGTLGRAGRPAVVPSALDAALDAGVTRTGIAFKARRGSQLLLLLDAVRDWRGQPASTRRRLLDDPWAFKAWLHGIPHDGAQAQRAALLHLVHPEVFEPIVSEGVKRRIVAAFAGHVPDGVDDVDEALAWVREALEPEHGRGFWFTAPGVVEHWR